MTRRRFLKSAAALLWLPSIQSLRLAPAWAEGTAARQTPARVRPGDPAWPSDASWKRLNQEVGGRLITVHSPLGVCQDDPNSPPCRDVFTALRACLKRSCSGCEPPHHQVDHGDPDPGLGRLRQGLEVFTQPPRAIEPAECALHDPAPLQHLKALGVPGRFTITRLRCSMAATQATSLPA